MSRYRRLHTPGASDFFTQRPARRGQTLLTDDITRLRQAYAERLQGNHRVRPDGFVILPDYPHAVRSLPAEDANFPNRWRRSTRLQLARSSLHRDIRSGRVSSDWAGGVQDGNFGE